MCIFYYEIVSFCAESVLFTSSAAYPSIPSSYPVCYIWLQLLVHRCDNSVSSKTTYTGLLCAVSKHYLFLSDSQHSSYTEVQCLLYGLNLNRGWSAPNINWQSTLVITAMSDEVSHATKRVILRSI